MMTRRRNDVARIGIPCYYPVRSHFRYVWAIRQLAVEEALSQCGRGGGINPLADDFCRLSVLQRMIR